MANKLDGNTVGIVCRLYIFINFSAPLPTYILGPNSQQVLEYYPDLKGCELAENIIYLGK